MFSRVRLNTADLKDAALESSTSSARSSERAGNTPSVAYCNTRMKAPCVNTIGIGATAIHTRDDALTNSG